jgi:hypothetical protein|tara:strand:- start:465 stop:689 length:225 start_codon:yes stop_codon:yes gene_type:complete
METLSTSEVLDKTGLVFYQLEYLVKTGRIPTFSYGKGLPRRYPLNTIEKIKAIMAKRGGDISSFSEQDELQLPT